MKIIKGGITREIDPARLQEYKDHGYTPEPEKEKPAAPPYLGKKPPKKE